MIVSLCQKPALFPCLFHTATIVCVYVNSYELHFVLHSPLIDCHCARMMLIVAGAKTCPCIWSFSDSHNFSVLATSLELDFVLCSDLIDCDCAEMMLIIFSLLVLKTCPCIKSFSDSHNFCVLVNPYELDSVLRGHLIDGDRAQMLLAICGRPGHQGGSNLALTVINLHSLQAAKCLGVLTI